MKAKSWLALLIGFCVGAWLDSLEIRIESYDLKRAKKDLMLAEHDVVLIKRILALESK